MHFPPKSLHYYYVSIYMSNAGTLIFKPTNNSILFVFAYEMHLGNFLICYLLSTVTEKIENLDGRISLQIESTRWEKGPVIKSETQAL